MRRRTDPPSGPAAVSEVASRRVDPDTTSLTAEGPDGAAVLRLIRTWA